MNRNIFIIAFLFFTFLVSVAMAQEVSETKSETASESEEYIDVNKDGEIDTVDNRQQWKYKNYPVDHDLEKKYDENSNGVLEPEESRKLLKERSEWIKFNTGAGVDSDILQQYDANMNGAIDAREAQEIRDDVSW